MCYKGAQKVGLVKFINVVRRKEGFMEELELDYVIIKLKKKSPRNSEENSK